MKSMGFWLKAVMIILPSAAEHNQDPSPSGCAPYHHQDIWIPEIIFFNVKISSYYIANYIRDKF